MCQNLRLNRFVRIALLGAVLTVSVGIGSEPGPAGAANGAEHPTGSPPKTLDGHVRPIWGVTLDCGYLPGEDGRSGLRELDARLPQIVDSLGHLASKPTVRVVLDPGANPRRYLAPLRKLHRVAFIMGELLDSSHLAQFSTDRYRAMARAYFRALGSLVDTWEIGNEVNGGWTGKPSAVGADVTAAYNLARARHLRTAVTFYLQAHQARRNRMLPWIRAHLSRRVRRGINYALISYYDNNVRLRWKPVFAQLARQFPHAHVGFGELGGDDTHSDRRFTLKHFYGRRVNGVPSYVGGYFYWYYCQDMVPYRRSDLWSLLDRTIARGWRPFAGPTRIAQIRTMSAPSLYGVTIDEVHRLNELAASERALPEKPSTRIYFDLKHGPSYYRPAVESLRRHSYVLGELLDSSDETKIGISAFKARVRSYLAAFGGRIDIWEIGNEVNGDWLGPYRDVAAKLLAADRQVSARGLRTALTLYYNVGCHDGPAELTPIVFSKRYVPRAVRERLDYVLLSYYPGACGGRRPSVRTWTAYLRRLHWLYPNSLLGFGEIGMKRPVATKTLPRARRMIGHYYALSIRYPYFIGGYFWWYYAEDCVPYRTRPLWQAIRRGFEREASLISEG